MASPTWKISVDAKLMWNATSVILVKGSAYRLRVLRYSDWRDAGIQATPGTGWEGAWKALGWLARFKARYRGAPMYSLVGSIEKDRDSFFRIDETKEYVAAADGELLLFANDWERHYENNHGSLQLEVIRVTPNQN